MNISDLKNKDMTELAEIGGRLELGETSGMRRDELVGRIMQRQSEGSGQGSAPRPPPSGGRPPLSPDKLINLETDRKNLTQRLINLVNPLGKGQRALIVSPPKAGKTFVLQDIANGITTNYPEILLMVALIGERPEGGT